MKSGGEIYPLVTFSFQKVQEHTALFLHQEKNDVLIPNFHLTFPKLKRCSWLSEKVKRKMFNTKSNQSRISVTDTSDNGFVAQRLNFVLAEFLFNWHWDIQRSPFLCSDDFINLTFNLHFVDLILCAIHQLQRSKRKWNFFFKTISIRKKKMEGREEHMGTIIMILHEWVNWFWKVVNGISKGGEIS